MTNSCDDSFDTIELPERIYKRVERIMKIVNAVKKWIASLKGEGNK